VDREQKTFIVNVGKLEYKVNTLVCKVNEEWQKKVELEILLVNIETIKLELKAYFMSLITGNRVKVDFKIEDALNEKLQGYVIIAKGYVLKANKEFQRLSFILKNIFLKIQVLSKNFDLIIKRELKIRKILIFDLGNIISNLNIILSQITELFNIISNLNTMILLSLKDQDKELHEEVNTNIINLRLLFDEIVNEVSICELNLKLCVEKENVLSHLNVSNVDNIAGFVGRERNQIREIAQINNLNKFELFTNQVKNMVTPLKEVFKDEINIVSYMSDIFFKLNYIQNEINSDIKIKNELGSIVNDGLNEIQGQLNLYMISKLKEQIKRIHVDVGYKFKEFKIYITGLIQKEDLIDLGEQSISKDFTDLSAFFLKFNDKL
jgi:ribosomal protein L19